MFCIQLFIVLYLVVVFYCIEDYNVVNDIKLEMHEIIEDNILDNEDINMDYDVFIDEDIADGNVLNLKDISNPEVDTNPHLSDFVPWTFHMCTKRSYTYMISCLQHEIEGTCGGYWT